ncbi:MAG: hypothetical protein NWE92_03880 [Candidatus Bathyarchaeota archaeon]|nr:hypothetical protein [Candidatus Bathyarchaeota archaeon]
MKIICGLALSIFAALIIICNFASYRYINITSTASMLLFNAFFISLFFLLNGSPIQKAGLLTIGNGLGFLWNLFFHYIQLTGYSYFGITFDALFTLIYPLLTLMWIVPFCSLTLSYLPKYQVTPN